MSTVNQSIKLLKDTLKTNQSCLAFLKDKEDTDLYAIWKHKVADLETAIKVLEDYERTL